MQMIVAHAKNRAIGKGNSLPWRVPADMKFFVKKTKEAYSLLVGKNTLLSMPPSLPERELNVLSSSFTGRGGINVIRTMEDAISKASSKNMMVIGGEQIYRAFLPLVDTLYVTEIDIEIEGADAFFPEYKSVFDMVEVIEEGVSNDVDYKIMRYTKKSL